MEDYISDILQNQPVIAQLKPKLQRNRYSALGVIESNDQIVRNESGQAKHREFKGPYIPLEQRPGRTDKPTDIHQYFDKNLFDKKSKKGWTSGWLSRYLRLNIFGRKRRSSDDC